MTRRTERVVSLSLLALTLVVAVTALVQLHLNRRVYTDQEKTLQGVLEETIQEACHVPRQMAVEKLTECREAVVGLQAEKGRLETWIGELDGAARTARQRMQLELAESAGRQRAALESLQRVEGGVTAVSGGTGRLLDAAEAQRAAVAELQGALRLPECLEGEDSSCHPPTLGLLALALDADLARLRREMQQELEGNDGFAGQLFRELEAQKSSLEQQSGTWIQTMQGFEEQLELLRGVIAERDRLRKALEGGVTPDPEVAAQGAGRFAVTIEPPIDGYRCENLELVAQLVDSSKAGNPPLAVGAELCQSLAGVNYQCGRLGGDHNSLTLWATYRDAPVNGRARCRAEVELPKPLIENLGAGVGSLKLRVGVHLQSSGGLVSIHLS